LLKAGDTLADQFFAVELLTFLVEASDIFHSCQLEEQETNREDVRLVNVVFGETRVTVDNVCLPEDR
jgi:hypothetical protein